MPAERTPDRWWFWACPECVGDIESSAEPARIRCVACGRTEVQWARRYPTQKIIMGTIFPDASYGRDAIEYDPAESAED